ncbi:MAG: hypothetical protein WCV58_04685, partial [Patescibacteria group bacterium]
MSLRKKLFSGKRADYIKAILLVLVIGLIVIWFIGNDRFKPSAEVGSPTQITNSAVISFKDQNNNTFYVQSNTVVTTISGSIDVYNLTLKSLFEGKPNANVTTGQLKIYPANTTDYSITPLYQLN